MNRWILAAAIWVLALVCIFSCHTNPVESEVIKITNLEANHGGTGFEVVTPSGHVYTVTNKHICESPANYAEVGDRHVPLRIIEISPVTDLCLLEGLSNHKGLRVSSHNPLSGEILEIYGYGLLLPLQHVSGRFVGNTPPNILGVPQPQFVTASILPGNSGSPVLDYDDHVVGVVYGGTFGESGTLIVSLSDLRDFLKPY